jgi:drug/metabolite transporter (DMT)-like permease
MPARPVSSTATLCGLAAILLWSTMIGMVRSVSSALGAVVGAAAIYTAGAVFLWLLFRPAPLHTARPGYLLLGGALFVAYELCLSQALGLATSDVQAMELGIINYLWPCFTILLAVPMNGQRLRPWIAPGLVLCLTGVIQVMGGSRELSMSSLAAGVASNPLVYLLAFTGAVLWGLYCNVTRRFARGYNGITLFFSATAATLWAFAAAQSSPLPAAPAQVWFEVVAAGAALGIGYALWNVGMLGGDMPLLTTASYATPLLSTVFAALWLGTALTAPFWLGAALVTTGSLLCWRATRPLPAAG